MTLTVFTNFNVSPCILLYFNFEINILDYYSVECEKVHVLVFINY